VAQTGSPAAEAVGVAFQCGLGLLAGREALARTSQPEVDQVAASLLEADANAALNAWRVLHRLRRHEALEPLVEQLRDENQELMARLVPARRIETIDQAAALERLFGRRRPDR
jgi:acyl-CoA reductase-like NAD-dependent aldehyde dehydrogenase